MYLKLTFQQDIWACIKLLKTERINLLLISKQNMWKHWGWKENNRTLKSLQKTLKSHLKVHFMGLGESLPAWIDGYLKMRDEKGLSQKQNTSELKEKWMTSLITLVINPFVRVTCPDKVNTHQNGPPSFLLRLFSRHNRWHLTYWSHSAL